LGPVIVLLTVLVFGSGVMLAVTGPGQGPWLLLHKASFILWFCAMTIHVLASLLAGLLIALLTVHLEGQWRPTGIPVHFKR
jgi:hypothetical protein